MRKSKFSNKIKQEILEKHRDGMTIPFLCKEYDISKTYLYRWIKENKQYYRKWKKTYISAQEIYLLERRIAELETENAIFRKSKCGTNSSIKEKVNAINRLKDEYTIYAVCKTLDILRSTYYHQMKRAPEKKWYEIRAETLKPKIKEIFELSQGRFGAGKIAIKMKKEGFEVGPGSISKMMKEMDLVCNQSKLRTYNTTNKCSKYRKNRLRRQFYQETPNTFWVSDISYMLVDRDHSYICAIIDLFSRKVIAFDVANNPDADFTLSVFIKAYNSRGYPENLTFHSDQGSQYTAHKFRRYLRDKGVKQSFSNPATPYDNAVAEAFFSMMKRESLSHTLFPTLDSLRDAVVEFVSFFNDYRPLRKLGNLSPVEYEEEYNKKLAEQNQEESDFKEYLEKIAI